MSNPNENPSETLTIAADAPEDLAAALRAVDAAPENDEAWETLEERAAEHQRPDDVEALIRHVLSRPLPPALANRIGERAARFINEWFDDPSVLANVISRVLELDPNAEWAFHRLTLLYTKARRWEELLGLYDRALAVPREPSARMKLLDEAAHVAKDFAGQDERAIGYLAQLFPLKPHDAQLAASLERLFERAGRHHDLIDLWTARLAVLPAPEARSTRVRIATCWLESLNDPARALAAIEPLADEEDPSAEPVLERVLALETAPVDARRRAMQLLAARYDRAGDGASAARVSAAGLAFSDGPTRGVLLRSLVERLTALGRENEALEHAAALLALEPAAPDALASLRALAERTEAWGRFADALARAADAASDPAMRAVLRVEAGDVREQRLQDGPGAAGLYARVLAAPGAPAPQLLHVARRLAIVWEGAGRDGERLSVLERLADLEESLDARRTALGKAAVLAEGLGDLDRALASWERRLAEDPSDAQALDATISLLERAGRWALLIDVLRRRATLEAGTPARRADLTRVASVQADRLGDVAAAIDTWAAVREEYGADSEVVDALGTLLERAGRYAEQGALLSDAAAQESDPARRAELLRRLGDTLRTHASDPAGAAERYALALEADPRNEGARAGMTGLLEESSCAARAASALAEAYASTDEWERTLGLLEHRLSQAASGAPKAALLLEAAALNEQRGGDAWSALSCVRRALPETPDDPRVEAELVRLAEATRGWSVAVEAYRDAVARAEQSADEESLARAARLRFTEGTLLESRLDDPAGALAVYLRVSQDAPARADATASVVRVAARAGRWDAAMQTLVRSADARASVDDAAFGLAEAGIAAVDAWAEATQALETAIAEAGSGLDALVAGDLEARAARWHRDQRGDAAAAEAAFLRSVARHRGDAAILRDLAELQRRAPSVALVDTLLALADVTQDDADVLHEAADVARGAGDPRAREVLARLFASASTGWREGAPGAGAHASWALERLVEHDTQGRHYEEAAALLLSASELPFAPADTRSLRVRAAELFAGPLAQPARAVDLYRAVLTEAPSDGRAIEALGALYTAQGQLDELLLLRQHELGLSEDSSRRIELRLEIARVLGELGDRDGRVGALRANLDEVPGDAHSIDELSRLLSAEGAYHDLCSELRAQAARVELDGDANRAAELWARAAEIAEARLGDAALASELHGRVVALAPGDAPALDALARLAAARGDHATAVRWLSQRLEHAPGAQRVDTVVRLAKAYVDAGDRPRATAVLEDCVRRDPSAHAARGPLGDLYREAGSWAPLADLLSSGVEYESDATAQRALLREAASVYHHRLGDPARAVPVLEQVVSLAPTDRPARTALADALHAVGRVDEARALLEALVTEFGRRRSPERAAVHFSIAQIAQAQGRLDETLAQLELATSMDPEHAGALKLLGDVARGQGDLARAEGAYRELLLVVRRGTDKSPDALRASEVLFDLYRVAQAQNLADRSTEILESAFETAGSDEREARRLERALRAAGERDLLLRALQSRIARGGDEASQSEALIEAASVLVALGRAGEALDAHLRALSVRPTADALHVAARAAARETSQSARYAEALEGLAAQCAGAGDVRAACELYLRLGAVYEEDLGDVAQATNAYRRAEETGVLRARVWSALERAYAARGDRAERVRVLRALGATDDPDASADVRADALFRLAELLFADEADPQAQAEAAQSVESALASANAPDYARAAAILRAAKTRDPKAAQLLEQSARALGDDALLLEALERAGALEGAAVEPLREAVSLAANAGEGARAERLLERAVALGDAAGAPASAVWAMVSLAESAKARDDFSGAVRWLHRAAQSSPDAQSAYPYALEAARLAAGPVGDSTLAASLYASLHANDPTDRAVYEPLFEILRARDDRAALERVLGATADATSDAVERNALRVERARVLMTLEGRGDETIAVLRSVLDEDMAHGDANVLLTDALAREGRHAELAEHLAHALEGALDRGDAAQIVVLSLRIGGLREAASQLAEAREVYRTALEWAPRDRSVLAALLRVFDPEGDEDDRANLTERLLEVETGPEAARITRELIAMREARGDAEGVERALSRGYRANPADDELRERLERFYTEREDFSSLASVLVVDALARTDTTYAVTRLREAARIWSEQLGEFDRAAEALAHARQRAPGDPEVLTERARALAASGQTEGAVEELSAALDDAAVFTGAPRIELLRLRAMLLGELGRDRAAVDDLAQVSQLGGPGYEAELAEALERWRDRSASSGNEADEGEATSRLAAVLSRAGQPDRASEILEAWVAKHPRDRVALRTLADLAASAERWPSVAEAYGRLAEAEEGDARMEAVARHAEAWERAGDPAAARPVLEAAFQEQPGSALVRARLRVIYQAAGAWRELAELATQDAENAPDDATRFEALREAGRLWILQVGDGERGAEMLSAALRLRPNDHEATALLIDAYIASGRVEEAVAVLEPAIAAHKNRRSAELAALQHRMARVAAAAGDHEVEIQWLNAALDCDLQNGHVAAELADLAMQMGQMEIALKALRAITLMKTPGPMSRGTAFLRQGQIAAQQGDPRKAVLLAKRALTEEAGHPEAVAFLRELGQDT